MVPSFTQRTSIAMSHLALVSVLALVGGISLLSAFVVKPIIGASIFAAIFTVLAAALSGNPWLFFLVGLFFVLPLDFAKTFTSYAHFGGEWGVRLEITDPFLLIVCLYWLKDFLTGKVGRPKIPAAAWWWAALIAEGFVVAAFLTYKTVAFFELIRMAKVLLLFLFIANTIRRKSLFQWVAVTILAVTLLQGLYGLAQYFGFSLGLAKLGEAKQMVTEAIGGVEKSRVGAMLGHPNMFAAYLIMVLPLAFTLLFTRLHAGHRALAVGVLIFGSASLIFTLSRGGWIAFGCGIAAIYLVSFFHVRIRSRAFWMRLFIFIAILGSGIAASGKIYEKFTMASRTSVSTRWDLMQIAKNMIYENPTLGVGVNSFTLVMPNYDNTGIDWGDMLPPVHNIYLLIWAEQGTVGFVFFLAMIAAVIKTGIANHRCRDDLLVNINLGALVGFCAVLIQGLADWPLRGSTIPRVFFALAGLIYAIHYWRLENETAGPPGAAPSPTGGLP